MRLVAQTVTGVATSNPILMDNYIAPFAVGFGAIISGTATYSVQHSFDGTNWFNHSTVNNVVANSDGNYAFPVLYLRLNVTASTGSVTWTVIQAGVAG